MDSEFMQRMGWVLIALENAFMHLKDSEFEAALVDTGLRNLLISSGVNPTGIGDEQPGVGRGQLSAVMLDFGRNTTENLLDARRGYLASLHLEQAGCWEGWVALDGGERWRLAPSSARGNRDKSWGGRRGGRAPRARAPAPPPGPRGPRGRPLRETCALPCTMMKSSRPVWPSRATTSPASMWCSSVCFAISFRCRLPRPANIETLRSSSIFSERLRKAIAPSSLVATAECGAHRPEPRPSTRSARRLSILPRAVSRRAASDGAD
jgi:hypothetical protein